MPPKSKRNQNNQSSQYIDSSNDEISSQDEQENGKDCPLSENSFKRILDDRLKLQGSELKDLVVKYNKITQDELKEIKTSQEFINAKFEQLSKTIEDLQCQNEFLKQENSQLKANTTEMSIRITQLEEDQEAQNLYLHRDCLELHGIPIQPGEDTYKLAQKVGELVGIKNEDISISHRLPTRGVRTPIIIAKFTRRSVRDGLHKARRNLTRFNATDLRFSQQNNKLYINEGLTTKAKVIFRKSKEFQKEHKFQFVWTKNGKTYMKQDNDVHSKVVSFSTLSEFERFKDQFTTTR